MASELCPHSNVGRYYFSHLYKHWTLLLLLQTDHTSSFIFSHRIIRLPFHEEVRTIPHYSKIERNATNFMEIWGLSYWRFLHKGRLSDLQPYNGNYAMSSLSKYLKPFISSLVVRVWVVNIMTYYEGSFVFYLLVLFIWIYTVVIIHFPKCSINTTHPRSIV